MATNGILIQCFQNGLHFNSSGSNRRSEGRLNNMGPDSAREPGKFVLPQSKFNPEALSFVFCCMLSWF